MPVSLLEQQLSRLRDAHPTALQVRQKRRPTFTFQNLTEEDAKRYFAEIEEDSLQIFLEVRQLDPTFGRFEKLFLPGQKGRQFLTKAECGLLDGELERVFLLLSPLFDSSKVAKLLCDFLIWKFECNVYNVDSLMRCLLPYGDTEEFARLVQVLHIPENGSRWFFLRELQKSRYALKRSVFVHMCRKDVGLLAFACETAVKTAELLGRTNRQMVSFVTAVLLELFHSEQSNKNDDALLRAAHPYIRFALKNPQFHDLHASALALLCHTTGRGIGDEVWSHSQLAAIALKSAAGGQENNAEAVSAVVAYMYAVFTHFLHCDSRRAEQELPLAALVSANGGVALSAVLEHARGTSDLLFLQAVFAANLLPKEANGGFCSAAKAANASRRLFQHLRPAELSPNEIRAAVNAIFGRFFEVLWVFKAREEADANKVVEAEESQGERSPSSVASGSTRGSSPTAEESKDGTTAATGKKKAASDVVAEADREIAVVREQKTELVAILSDALAACNKAHPVAVGWEVTRVLAKLPECGKSAFVDFVGSSCDLLGDVCVVAETDAAATKEGKKKKKKAPAAGSAPPEPLAAGKSDTPPVPVFHALTHASPEMRVRAVEKAVAQAMKWNEENVRECSVTTEKSTSSSATKLEPLLALILQRLADESTLVVDAVLDADEEKFWQRLVVAKLDPLTTTRTLCALLACSCWAAESADAASRTVRVLNLLARCTARLGECEKARLSVWLAPLTSRDGEDSAKIRKALPHGSAEDVFRKFLLQVDLNKSGYGDELRKTPTRDECVRAFGWSFDELTGCCVLAGADAICALLQNLQGAAVADRENSLIATLYSSFPLVARLVIREAPVGKAFSAVLTKVVDSIVGEQESEGCCSENFPARIQLLKLLLHLPKQFKSPLQRFFGAAKSPAQQDLFRLCFASSAGEKPVLSPTVLAHGLLLLARTDLSFAVTDEPSRASFLLRAIRLLMHASAEVRKATLALVRAIPSKGAENKVDNEFPSHVELLGYDAKVYASIVDNQLLVGTATFGESLTALTKRVLQSCSAIEQDAGYVAELLKTFLASDTGHRECGVNLALLWSCMSTTNDPSVDKKFWHALPAEAVVSSIAKMDVSKVRVELAKLVAAICDFVLPAGAAKADASEKEDPGAQEKATASRVVVRRKTRAAFAENILLPLAESISVADSGHVASIARGLASECGSNESAAKLLLHWCVELDAKVAETRGAKTAHSEDALQHWSELREDVRSSFQSIAVDAKTLRALLVDRLGSAAADQLKDAKRIESLASYLQARTKACVQQWDASFKEKFGEEQAPKRGDSGDEEFERTNFVAEVLTEVLAVFKTVLTTCAMKKDASGAKTRVAGYLCSILVTLSQHAAVWIEPDEGLRSVVQQVCVCVRELTKHAADDATTADNSTGTNTTTPADNKKASGRKAIPSSLFVYNLRACTVLLSAKIEPALITFLKTFTPANVDSFLLACAGSTLDRFGGLELDAAGSSSSRDASMAAPDHRQMVFLHYLFQCLYHSPSVAADGGAKDALSHFAARGNGAATGLSSLLLPWFTAYGTQNNSATLLSFATKLLTESTGGPDRALGELAKLLQVGVAESARLHFYSVALEAGSGKRTAGDKQENSDDDDEEEDRSSQKKRKAKNDTGKKAREAAYGEFFRALLADPHAKQQVVFQTPLLCVQLSARYLVQRGIAGVDRYETSVSQLVQALFLSEAFAQDAQTRMALSPLANKRRLALLRAVQDVRKTILAALQTDCTLEFWKSMEQALGRCCAPERSSTPTPSYASDLLNVILTASMECLGDQQQQPQASSDSKEAATKNKKRRLEEADEQDPDVIESQTRMLRLVATACLTKVAVVEGENARLIPLACVHTNAWRFLSHMLTASPVYLAATCSSEVLPLVPAHLEGLTKGWGALTPTTTACARQMFLFLAHAGREVPKKLLLPTLNEVAGPMLHCLEGWVKVEAQGAKKSSAANDQQPPVDALCLALSNYATTCGKYLSGKFPGLLKIYLDCGDATTLQQLDVLLKTWLQALPFRTFVPLFRDEISARVGTTSASADERDAARRHLQSQKEVLKLTYLFQHLCGNTAAEVLSPFANPIFDDVLAPLTSASVASENGVKTGVNNSLQQLIAGLYAKCALRLEVAQLSPQWEKTVKTARGGAPLLFGEKMDGGKVDDALVARRASLLFATLRAMIAEAHEIVAVPFFKKIAKDATHALRALRAKAFQNVKQEKKSKKRRAGTDDASAALRDPVFAAALASLLETIRASLSAPSQPSFGAQILTELAEPLIDLYEILPIVCSASEQAASSTNAKSSAATASTVASTTTAAQLLEMLQVEDAASPPQPFAVHYGNFEQTLVQTVQALVHQLAEEDDRKQLILSLLHKTQDAKLASAGGLAHAHHSATTLPKIALVKTLKSVWRKSGCAVVSSLSDTMLFAVELLEDDSEVVEKETKELLKIVQQVTGEDVAELLKDKN